MSREIKFRSWDTLDKKIITMEDESWGEFWDSCDPGYETTRILMQFTGLKDNNGKEIYEGDIVKGGWDCEEGRVVEFTDGGFEPFSRSNGQDGERAQWVEVIGNIYDNPDLIGKEHDALRSA